jgi:K+-sensing histidine kinase KdpD
MQEKIKWQSYLWGVLCVAILTLLLLPIRVHVNSTTVALLFLIIVVFTAIYFGSRPAFVASLCGVLAFNFFFLPPFHTLRIADPQNWIALFVFLITALTVGSLSAREKHRAQEAQRLYVELQSAFEKASQAEALKQSEQLKSALLDAVSHDLRTPLTSMKAAVTTLLSKTDFTLDEEGKREMLEVIDAEIDRLNHLLEGLIGIAKIEAGAMQPRRSWSNFEEIVSISMNRAAGLTSNHKITLDLDSDLPPIRVDEKSIAEVIYVLLENATKFSPVHSEIIVSAKVSGDSLKVSVTDQGPGVPVDLREKVFEKFFRVPTPDVVRSRPAGLGMGLAIARGIVEAHGGQIWIEESRKGGASVTFTIPLKEQYV